MTPVSKWISVKVGAIDYPKDRGTHTKPMPRMGGIAIVVGFMATILVLLPWMKDFDMKEITGLLVGGALVALLGFFDDIYNLNAKLKLCIQIVAALIIVYFGITIDFISWPFVPSKMVYLGSLSTPITIIWIIGVTNAVNLIDGLDGLAAGVSSIAALCLMFLCLLTGNMLAVILTAALAGACMGFLPHNFNPAEVFMGDTGSTFLGFVLAVSSIKGVFKVYTALAVIVAILVLGLPLFDTTFAICRRIIKRQPVMKADRGHLHHRLLDRGYSHKRAVLTLYGISGGFGITAILIAARDVTIAIGVASIMAVLLLMFRVYRKRV